MGVRLAIVSALFVGLYGLLFFNLYKLQLEQGFYYSDKAALQNALAGGLEAKRGNIYFSDRSGNTIPASLNRDFPTVYAVPEGIEDAKEAAAMLEPIAGIAAGVLEQMFSKPGDLYELILEKASEEQAAKIKELNLAGIYMKTETLRFYPWGKLASQVLGFVGINKDTSRPTGLYGLELFYNDFLKGKDGEADGKDLILTIDPALQFRSEDTLSVLIENFKATGGTVIIQEPKSGKVLAIANQPSFDPNAYSEFDLATFINSAVQKIYEPGSVFKVITMAAGIDSGKLTPETTYYDSGSVKVADRTITNWDHKAHGNVTMTQVIEKSINTGAVYAEKVTGHDIFYNYVVKFGFGSKTGADLPGEVTGDLRNLSNPRNEAVNFANASFGQGVAVTPLQLINAASAIANNGVLMKPYINNEIQPEALGRVISEESAKEIAKMMVSAVDKAGVAVISKYSVAGKTGTAQVPDFVNGGYADEFIHTYVGWAPAYNPSFVVLIKLDKPQSSLAALTVVPAFRSLAEFILNYYHIPPDRL